MQVLMITRDRGVYDRFVDATRTLGYHVEFASGEDAERRVREGDQHLTVVQDDPPFDAASFVRRVRSSGFVHPILAVHQHEDEEHRLRALLAGADQCCPATASPRELRVRVHAGMRQCDPTPADVLTFRDLKLDLDALCLTRADRPLSLNGKALALLEYFLRHPDKVIARDKLGRAVWGPGFDTDSNSFEVTLSKVRAQIDRGFDERYLHTISGRGYVLSLRPTVDAATHGTPAAAGTGSG